MKRFKFKNTKQFRLPDHDYSSAGFYFLTFNVKDKEPLLGEIKNGAIELSDIGKKTAECWQQIPFYFKRANLDEWIIMPDHMHGIIQLKEKPNFLTHGRNTPWSVPPMGEKLNKGINEAQMNEFGKNIPHSISLIINQFKGSVKRWCNQNGYPCFFWQRRFNDQIIHHQNDLNRVRQYIRDNPVKWQENQIKKE